MSQPVRLIFVLMMLYVTVAGGFLLFRREILYLFVETSAEPDNIPRTEVKVLPATPNDPPLTVWVTEPEPGQPVILYFMGNAGALSVYEPRLREFAEAGFGVAAMAYRGGGGQVGAPSEQAFRRDAIRVYEGLDSLFAEPIPADDRVIYGFGLGSGIAVRLAAEHEEMALVLEAPFSRMCHVVQEHFFFLPACAVMRDERYDNSDYIGAVDSTILFLHGAEDTTVPLYLGRDLYISAPDPKFVQIYPRGGHEDLARFGVADDVIRFLNVLRGGR